MNRKGGGRSHDPLPLAGLDFARKPDIVILPSKVKTSPAKMGGYMTTKSTAFRTIAPC